MADPKQPRQRILCPDCGRRPLRNAVRVFELRLVDEPPGGGVLDLSVALGCRRCLAGRLGRGLWSLRRWTSLLGPRPVLPQMIEAALLNAWWIPAIALSGGTSWLKGALADAGIPYRDFLAGRALSPRPRDLDRDEQIDLARALATLLRTVAQSRGRPSLTEWRALRGYLEFYWESQPDVFAAADPGEAILDEPNVEDVLTACRTVRRFLAPTDHSLLLHMMAGLLELRDGSTEHMVARVREIARECGVDDDDIRQVIGDWKEPEPPEAFDTDDPWRIFDLGPGTKRAAIRRRYLQLVFEHHPDRHAHLGSAFQAAANRRLQQINDAYQQLT